MVKFEHDNEERERRKRQREREWHLFMDDVSLLQDKLNAFRQKKTNANDSIEEQLEFIRVRSVCAPNVSSSQCCHPFRIKNVNWSIISRTCLN